MEHRHSELGDSFQVVVLGSYAPSLLTFRGPMIAAMVKRGWRVMAVAPDIDESVAARLADLGAESFSVRLARTGMNPLSDLGYFRELGALIRTLSPDALLAYTAKPVIWGALSTLFMGRTRVVALITGLGYAFTDLGRISAKQLLARTAVSILYRLALMRADKVLFQNPDDRDLFVGRRLVRNDGRIVVIDGSGVDLAHYARTPLPRAPAFLMIARLLGAKGVREYAEAALSLKARYPDAVFRLVGWIDPGPDAIAEEELQSWICRGLDYLGHLPDVRPALADASVYVLPSYREGTPRSVLEAMALGRAVVTTDAPGCRETVADGQNGFLVPPRDAAALAAAMERFLVDPALANRMGQASFERVCERYDVDKVNLEIMEAVRPIDRSGAPKRTARG